MRIRWLGSLALTLSLLAASTVGLVGHDHATGVERTGYDCAVDHGRDHGAASERLGLDPAAVGKPHHHHCPGCHLSGHRIVPASTRAIAGAGPIFERAPEPRLLPRLSLSWTGRTLRGPPAA